MDNAIKMNETFEMYESITEYKHTVCSIKSKTRTLSFTLDVGARAHFVNFVSRNTFSLVVFT